MTWKRSPSFKAFFVTMRGNSLAPSGLGKDQPPFSRRSASKLGGACCVCCLEDAGLGAVPGRLLILADDDEDDGGAVPDAGGGRLIGRLRATRGFPEARGLRRGGAPGGGVGFWPCGPVGGDALMMTGDRR